MAGSLDDRAALVLTPAEYDFAIIGSLIPGKSTLYRNPLVHPTEVASALRRIADSFDVNNEGNSRESNQ